MIKATTFLLLLLVSSPSKSVMSLTPHFLNENYFPGKGEPSAGIEELSASCRTIFIFTDCDDTTVPGATVKITTCKGEQFGSITDTQGSVSFSVCSDDICKVEFLFIGLTAKEISNFKSSCTSNSANNKEKTCRFKVCD